MKTLLIVRHAKSSWKDDALPDHERPLNKRGEQDAPRVGQWLRAQGLVPDVILSSTAVRARATAAAVAAAAGYEGEIQLSRLLYGAAPEAYLSALRRMPEAVATALVVGHNPGLEELLTTLTGDEEPMPTAAVARVSLSLSAWGELSEDTEATLIELWRPREDP